MANISVKLNLAGLKHSRKLLKGQSGEIDCLIIPINENKLFKGEKGLYLDLTLIEIKDRSKQSPDQKDTHLVKQSFTKEVYDAMSEEERKSYPILGNAILWSSNSNEPALAEPKEEDDDLPFQDTSKIKTNIILKLETAQLVGFKILK